MTNKFRCVFFRNANFEFFCNLSRNFFYSSYGFEIYFKGDEDIASKMFLELAEKGKEFGIIPAGLGARDTLRLEAGMALYGNDIDDSHTVLEANLGWILKLKKGDFIGKAPLLKQKEEGVTRKLVGFELIDRGIARHGYPVFIDGKQFGEVTSGTYGPFLKKSIGMAYLPIDKTELGTEFQIEIRNKIGKRKPRTPGGKGGNCAPASIYSPPQANTTQTATKHPTKPR